MNFSVILSDTAKPVVTQSYTKKLRVSQSFLITAFHILSRAETFVPVWDRKRDR